MTATLTPAPSETPHPRPIRASRRSAPANVATPRLSVVIVNYGQWEDTARLVRQVRSTERARRGEIEVVVVDNYSPPHPLLRALRRAPGVSLRRWSRNRGYARAVNEGCRLSQGSWVLLLNPDVTLGGGFLEGVLRVMSELNTEEPRAGAVGFHLRHADGTRQLSVGRFPTFLTTLAGLCLPRARRKYRRVHAKRRCRVSWATGCCLLLRRECMLDVDGFDEDFFLYYEDVDFCRRAQQRGWSVWYEPGLRAVHHRPLHRREVTPELRLCTRHGLLTYAAKHWGAASFYILSALVRLESWYRHRRGASPETAFVAGQLDAAIAELSAGRFSAARRCVDRVMGRHAITALA